MASIIRNQLQSINLPALLTSSGELARDVQIEVGEFLVSIDGGAPSPLTNTPQVIAGTATPRATITAAESNGGSLLFIASGNESWAPYEALFETGLATADQVSELGDTIAALEVTRNVHLQTVFESLELVRGDRHNGVNAPKLEWPTVKTYVLKPVKLLIFSGAETVLAEGNGVANGNTITIDDLQCEFASDLFRGNPLTAKLHYAVVAGTEETLRFGRCNVQFRPDID